MTLLSSFTIRVLPMKHAGCVLISIWSWYSGCCECNLGDSAARDLHNRHLIFQQRCTKDAFSSCDSIYLGWPNVYTEALQPAPGISPAPCVLCIGPCDEDSEFGNCWECANISLCVCGKTSLWALHKTEHHAGTGGDGQMNLGASRLRLGFSSLKRLRCSCILLRTHT